ncbi:MAG: hypothetical protein ACD_41C00252G0002 [uncultured bacterium]|nr:MAG: hypothetical protein ACD_41C00252G0002 [uncultured bacterium]
MRALLVIVGVGLLSVFTSQTPTLPPTEPQSEAVTFSAPTLSELDQQLMLARAASAEDNFDEAIKLFADLEQSGSHRHRWAAISGQINIYRRQYNIAPALEITARLIAAEPPVAGLMHVWNGDMYLQLKNYDSALAEYQTAEQQYGSTVVNNAVMGELALKQASRAAIQFQHPDQAAKFSRKMAEKYPTTGNPETALARGLLYEAMARGDLPIKTLETILYDGICSAAKPCFIDKQRLQKNPGSNRAQFQQLGGVSGISFKLNKTDQRLLKRIRQANKLSISQAVLQSVVPAAQATTVSYTTCDVEDETAYQGFSDPMTVINRGDLFMGFPAAASTSVSGNLYHPGVDLNGAYDAGYDCDVNQVTGPDDADTADDRFTTTAAGCVQDASTADWGSLAITHNYPPYDGDFAADYTTSQYGHADDVFVEVFESFGDSVGTNEVIGSIGGIDNNGNSTWACHLHFEIREPDHPDPYNAGYWASSVLSSQDSVGLYYQDPESFIDAHPAFDWITWIDESASQWSYVPNWTYVNTKGNGNDAGENDLNYTSTTAASSPSATATLSFTAENDGNHTLWMFVPWSLGSKSDSVPVVLTSADTGNTVFSTTLDFYGPEVVGNGTCDRDFDGDGIWDDFDPTKRCDEWISIGSANLTSGGNYELEISNATGANGDIIIIDDVLIVYEDNVSSWTTTYRISTLDDDECTVPSSGDWTITDDCVISSAITAPQNVLVADNVTLTINGSGSLAMDLSSYHLLIGDGSKVIIETGGKID